VEGRGREREGSEGGEGGKGEGKEEGGEGEGRSLPYQSKNHSRAPEASNRK